MGKGIPAEKAMAIKHRRKMNLILYLMINRLSYKIKLNKKKTRREITEDRIHREYRIIEITIQTRMESGLEVHRDHSEFGRTNHCTTQCNSLEIFWITNDEDSFLIGSVQ